MLKPDTWIEEYADYLYHYAIVRLNDHDLANDLIQETFFSGLRSTKNFKGFATERTWLTSILKRKIIDYYREVNSEKGRSEVRISLYEDTEQESPLLEKQALQNYENEVEKKIESAELLRQIDDCISRLPPKHAKAFHMKTIQELETEQICKELEITPTHLRVMTHRARVQLRKCLEKNWFNN